MLTSIQQGNRRINNRRAVKTMVEVTIGVIGIIGIMLAQIASNHEAEIAEHSSNSQQSIMSSFGNGISEKVESISKVSPMASQINLSNILF